MARKRYVETDDFIDMLGRLVQAAGKRTGRADPEQLAKLIQVRAELDRAILKAVQGLRATGITWASIGEATGTTRQAAIQKWAKDCEAYDPRAVEAG